jgi:autotransporter-associated beta strand protein
MIRPVAAILLSLIAALPSSAQTTYTWTGSQSAAWNTTANNFTTDGTTNIPWVNGNDAAFTGTAAGTINLGSGITANSATFSANGYTIAGNTLTLSSTTAPFLAVSNGASATITSGLTVNGDLTVSGSTGGGTIVLDGGAGQLSFTGTTTNTLSITGATVQVANTANLGFGSSQIPSTTNLSLGTGGAFVMGGSGGNGGSFQFASLAGVAGSKLLIGATGTNNTFLTLALAGGATSTFNGDIGYVGGSLPAGQTGHLFFVIQGTGTLVLGGNNTYASTTSVTSTTVTLKLGSATALGAGGAGTTVSMSGTLDLNGQNLSGAFQSVDLNGSGSLVNTAGTAATLAYTLSLNGSSNSVGGSGNITLSKQITGPGGNKLVKVGTGTVTLTNNSGTRSDYSGGTQINAGTLRFGVNNALPAAGAGSTGNVNINGGTLSAGTSGNAGFSLSANVLSVTGTTSRIELGTTNVHTLTFASFDNTGFNALAIDNWQGTPGSSGTAGRIVVTNPGDGVTTGLTAAVLAGITFTGFGPGAQIIAGNELSPVPEPATVLGVAALGFGLVRTIRRKTG